MKKYSHRDYFDAVSEFVDVVGKKYGNQIKAVYAGGSFARGDFVLGRSDVDLYIVAEDNKEELQKDLQNEALEIEKKHFNNLRDMLGEVLGVSVTTFKEVEDGSSFLAMGFEYTNFIREGKLLWGEDVKPLIPKPSAETQRRTAKNYLGELFRMVSSQERSFKWLKLIPFKLVPKRNKERWTRQAFNLTFRTAALFLGSEGVNVSSKEDIESAFKAFMQKEEKLCGIMAHAFSLWEKWKTEPLSDKEAKQLLENSGKFVKGLQLLGSSL